MAVAQESRRGKFFPRLVGLLVFLAVLWCGAWAAAYFGANWAVDQAEALNSPTSRCTERQVSGFPLTIQLGCGQASVEERVLGVAANVSGISASVPLYYPLRLDARAAGPLVIGAPDQGVSLTAEWDSAATSTEAWPFGQPGLKRFSADVEGLTITASGRNVPPIDGIRVQRGSIRIGPGDATDSLAISVEGDGVDLTAATGVAIEPVMLRLALRAPGFGDLITPDLGGQLRSWLSLGGQVQLDNLWVETGGLKVGVSGPLTIGPDGLVSGTVLLSFAGLELIPSLPEQIRPGDTPEETRQIVDILTGFTRPVEVDGQQLRQVQAIITNGQIRIGIVPLPVTIPSIFAMASTASGQG